MGQKASYPGVLLPELNYRNYKAMEGINTELLTQVLDKGIPTHEPTPWLDYSLWFLGGVATGMIAVELAR